jgi:HNH endonuclease
MAKSRKKNLTTKDTQKKRNGSRHIPTKVSEAVKKQHFFECAWCGVHLTDRHHIYEYAKGGKHTIENLILLCPNHHDMVHKGEISEADLLLRKSTHKKGDHISNGVQFDLQIPKVIIGGMTAIQTPIILAHDDQAIISLSLIDRQYFLNARFYNSKGDLIFWMGRNMYWTMSNFEVTSSGKSVKITDLDGEQFLNIYQEGDALKVEGIVYLPDLRMVLHPTHIDLPRQRKIIGGQAIRCGVAISDYCTEEYLTSTIADRIKLLYGDGPNPEI